MIFVKYLFHGFIKITLGIVCATIRGCLHDTGMTYSGTSSLYLHIFLCICLHDTKTKFRSRTSHYGMSLFQFSIRMKISFWYDISFWCHVLKGNFVTRWNPQTAQSEATSACVSFSRRRERLTLSRSTVIWMQYQLHSGTGLIPEWNRNSPLNKVD